MLGRPRLELDGQPLTRLMAPKHQALVFHLAAEGGCASRAQLAALLWGELEETAARANLRVALTRLRRWLPDMLDIDPHQVAFAPGAPVSVDLTDLTAALGTARAHDVRVAAARAWRGPLLEGFDLAGAEGFERWLALARQRAQRDSIALRHALAADARAAGQSDQAIEHLRALLEIDDADESAHVALMENLFGGGQRTAAIAQYEACRAALAERHGARPSASCYALYVQIHADSPAAQPAAALLAAPVLAVMTTPLLPANGSPPDGALPLVGRATEMALIAERLADAQCRWLTIVGPGGVGKTRLAQAAAQAFGSRFRCGTLWLSGRDPGGPLRDSETLVQHVLAHTAGDHFAASALLLVLDNLESLESRSGLARSLQLRAPGITVLATSRRRLGGSREWLLELTGLSFSPDAAGRPASSAAACLLGQFARRLDARFDLAEHAVEADRVCTLVGGLPLALELTARSVQQIGLVGVIERLGAGDLLADDGANGDGDRPRSLNVVLEESWVLLDEPSRSAALRLACLPGSFDLSLAVAVGASRRDIDLLREHAWLSRTDEGHLALHPLQQEFLRRRTESAALRPQVRAGIVANTRAALPAVAPFGSWPANAGPAVGLSRRAAFATSALPEALAHFFETDTLQVVAGWVDAVVALLLASDRAAEAAALLAVAVRRKGLPDWREAGWILLQGEIHNSLGDVERARQVFESGLDRMGINPQSPDGDSGQGLLRSMWRMGARRGWPEARDERRAFQRLLLRCLLLLGQQQAFVPHTTATLRTVAVASVLTLITRNRTGRLCVRTGNLYGATLFGASPVARMLAPGVANRPRSKDDPLLDAFIDHTHSALLMALGRWEGLLPRIEALAQAFVRLGDHRHEMECHSLAGKLLFYQGQLAASLARFMTCNERGLQLPAGAYRAFGPFGLTEVGLCLGTVPLAELVPLAETGGHWITELETMDNAYALRRLGLAARLAWLAGDTVRATQSVMAGVAAAARLRRCGFWAHEGYAGIGEGLVRLRQRERDVGGAMPPLDRAWATYERALRAHVKRFPPAGAMLLRLQAQILLGNGQTAPAQRLLLQSIRLAERSGMRVELARSCDILARLSPDAQWADRASRLWADMRLTH